MNRNNISSLHIYCNTMKGFVNRLWYVALMFCERNKRISCFFLSVTNSKQKEMTAVLIFKILIKNRKSVRLCKSFWPLTYWIPWFSIKSGTMCLENSSNYIVACQRQKAVPAVGFEDKYYQVNIHQDWVSRFCTSLQVRVTI